jgi:NTP pyrophosphatase (non-canonical NTP hydrolase)
MSAKNIPAVAELLEMLAEESAEVVQACTKALRHGLLVQPEFKCAEGRGYDNLVALKKEVLDVFAVLNILREEHSLDLFASTGEIRAAMGRKLQYTHHQERRQL